MPLTKTQRKMLVRVGNWCHKKLRHAWFKRRHCRIDVSEERYPFDPAPLVDAFRPFTKATTPSFTLDGMKRVVRVVSVYDGDTLTFVTTLGRSSDGKPWRFAARIRGINTPEIKDADPALKKRAIDARDRLVGLISGRDDVSLASAKDVDAFLEQQVCLVHVSCGPFEKYGRVLVDVHTPDGVNVATSLIDEGHAVKFMC